MSESSYTWRQTVLWEAAVCLSLPTWATIVPHDWPLANGVFFALIVGGSILATLFCHVLPGLSGKTFAASYSAGNKLIIKQSIFCLLAVGASVSFVQLVANLLYFLSPALHFNGLTSAHAMVASFILLITLFVTKVRLEKNALILFSLLFSVTLLSISLYAQRSGLSARDLQFSDPPPLHAADFLFGFVLALSPIVLLPWKLGFTATRSRDIWTSGLLGVCLPLCLSITLVSLSQDSGARLFRRPSLPLGVEFAFTWIPNYFGRFDSLYIFLVPTLLAPIMLCMLWIREALEGVGKTYRAGMLLATAAGALFTAQFGSESMYFFPWFWALLVFTLLAALWALPELGRARRKRL